MKQLFPLLWLFKNPTNIFLFVGFSVLFFMLNYWAMKNLVGGDPAMLQCTIGGSLTPLNIAFAAILSFMMGVFLVGMKEVFVHQKKLSAVKKATNVSIFSVAGFFGFFTIFCPVCTIGVVSIFGVSFGLNFFLDFNYEIKLASLVLLLIGVLWINSQLKDNCEVCKFVNKKPKKS